MQRLPALVVGLCALVAGPSRSPRGRFATVETGPRNAAAPAHAVIAADASSLRALLADPNGPPEIWLGAQVYRGDLRLSRRVALHGVPGSVLVGSGTDTVLTISADDVTVDNLEVRGSGRRHTHEDAAVKASGRRVTLSHLHIDDSLFGVSLMECRACLIDHVSVHGLGGAEAMRGDGIKLWEADDSVIRDSTVEEGRDVVVWYSRRVTLERDVMHGNRYGTHFMYAHDSTVRGCRFTDNVVGIFVMYSARLTAERNVLAGARGAAGMGIGFKDSDRVTLRGNFIVANTTGAYLDRTPRSPSEPVTFDGNVLALNNTALRFHSSERGVRFVGNDFRQNVETAAVDGGGDALGLEFRGNHFSDYAGYDLDGDGIGDVPYELKQLESAVTDQHPALRFFDGTAALGMMDAVARAVPVLSVKKTLVDERPAMKPLPLVQP